MKALVILPSYNESQNIANLVREICKEQPTAEVLVVDDNSPDGTAEVIRKLQAEENMKSRLHLIVRQKKDGRGGAVRAGIEWGIKEGRFASFVEMDCDFSHHPRYLGKGLEMLSKFPVVLGSRYPDGEIIGWPAKRKILSFFANILARSLISFRVADYTNGYRFYTKDAASYLCQFQQKNKGYIYLSETLAHFLSGKFAIGSFPIVFVNRERGESNTTFSEVFKSLSAIFVIGWQYRFGSSSKT